MQVINLERVNMHPLTAAIGIMLDEVQRQDGGYILANYVDRDRDGGYMTPRICLLALFVNGFGKLLRIAQIDYRGGTTPPLYPSYFMRCGAAEAMGVYGISVSAYYNDADV